TLDVCLAEMPLLCEQLDQGSKRDLTAWAKAVPDKEAEPPHVHKPTLTTSSYKATAPGKLPLVSKTPRRLLGSLSVPPGVQVARLAVDIGAAVNVRLEMVCSGSEEA